MKRGARVVAYATTTSMWAAQLWWMLSASGSDDVAVLDGGFEKWEAVLEAIGDGAACTINALSPGVHSGESAMNYCGKGHIEGCRNVPDAASLNADGPYRDDTELRSLFEAAGAFDRPRVICYCGGGISATMDALALTRPGYRSVAVYDGSMSEQSRDPSLPMQMGA